MSIGGTLNWFRVREIGQTHLGAEDAEEGENYGCKMHSQPDKRRCEDESEDERFRLNGEFRSRAERKPYEGGLTLTCYPRLRFASEIPRGRSEGSKENEKRKTSEQGERKRGASLSRFFFTAASPNDDGNAFQQSLQDA